MDSVLIPNSALCCIEGCVLCQEHFTDTDVLDACSHLLKKMVVLGFAPKEMESLADYGIKKAHHLLKHMMYYDCEHKYENLRQEIYNAINFYLPEGYVFGVVDRDIPCLCVTCYNKKEEPVQPEPEKEPEKKCCCNCNACKCKCCICRCRCVCIKSKCRKCEKRDTCHMCKRNR